MRSRKALCTGWGGRSPQGKFYWGSFGKSPEGEGYSREKKSTGNLGVVGRKV